MWERIAGADTLDVALESATAEMQVRSASYARCRRGSSSTRVRCSTSNAESHAIPHMEGAPFVEIEHAQAGACRAISPSRAPTARAIARSRTRSAARRSSFAIASGVYLATAWTTRSGARRRLWPRRVPRPAGGGGVAAIGVDLDPAWSRGAWRRDTSRWCRPTGSSISARAPGRLDRGDLLRTGDRAPAVRGVAAVPRALARAKLRSDGILIAETVNPHSAAALKTFWVDPTHQHPIFPEVALALAARRALRARFVFHPNGSRDVSATASRRASTPSSRAQRSRSRTWRPHRR